MNRPAVSRRHAPGLRGRVSRLSPVAAAISGLLVSAGMAQAQSADKPAADPQTVTVTGIRRGIEASVAVKRNSDSIVEAVSSEDIGKLPDVSIAESLARLPGLTAQRVDGRAQRLSIRGLSPNYATSLLNGREVVSSSDSRDAEFDQFPSELLSGAVIYKTPDAALIGQGLAGTADMRTVRPLDFSSRQLAFNLRGEHNGNGQVTDGSGANGKRFSAAYIDQFANRTVGLALGFAHLDSPGQEKHYKSWWWANLTKWGAQLPGQPDDAVTLNGFEATATSSKQTRDGLMAVVEFKPNKNYHGVVDLYYSKFEQERTMRGLMADMSQAWDGAAKAPLYTNVGTTMVNGDKILTSGTISNLATIVRNDYNTRDDKIVAFGWNNKLKFGDKWTAVADLSYSRAERDEQILETYAGQAARGAFDFQIATSAGVSQFKPSLNYADAGSTVLMDPRGWGHDGLVKYPHVTDDIKALRLSVKRDLDGVFSAVEAGVHYGERSKEVNKTEFDVNLKNDRAPMAVSSDLLRPATSLSFAGIPASLAYDVMGVFGKYYDLKPAAPWAEQSRHYDINEEVSTAYVKGDIDTRVGPFPLRGNVGVQFVHTSQSSNGFAWTGSSSVPITGGKSYSDVLPSLNLALELRPDTYVRLGLAKTVARPRMEDMRAGFDQPKVDGTTHKWGGSGGNPWLEPWRAESYDLSVEKYIGKRSYVAAALFKKHLETFIYNKAIDYDFTGFPNTSGVTPVSPIGTLNAPANGNGGYVEGLELSGTLEGSLLTPMLDGFGIVASASKTRSSLHEDNDVKKPLDGLSGIVNNLTVYYEKGGFSTRISQRYRSAFQTKTRGVFLDNITSIIEAEKQVDFQLGYAFDSGSMKGLSLLLQVNNLTNEPYRTRKGIDAGSATPGSTLPERYTTYGRQILFGLNYKL